MPLTSRIVLLVGLSLFGWSEEIKEESVKLKKWSKEKYAKHKHKLDRIFKKKKPDHDTILKVKTAIRDLVGDYESESRLWDIIVLLKSIPNPPDHEYICSILERLIPLVGKDSDDGSNAEKYMMILLTLLSDDSFSYNDLESLSEIYMKWYRLFIFRTRRKDLFVLESKSKEKQRGQAKSLFEGSGSEDEEDQKHNERMKKHKEEQAYNERMKKHKEEQAYNERMKKHKEEQAYNERMKKHKEEQAYNERMKKQRMEERQKRKELQEKQRMEEQAYNERMKKQRMELQEKQNSKKRNENKQEKRNTQICKDWLS